MVLRQIHLLARFDCASFVLSSGTMHGKVYALLSTEVATLNKVKTPKAQVFASTKDYKGGASKGQAVTGTAAVQPWRLLHPARRPAPKVKRPYGAL